LKKTVNKLFFLPLFLATVLVFKSTLAKEFSFLENLSSENLLNFQVMINNVCKSKKIFASIKSHHSYPKFGTVKVWKKNCEELKKIGNTKREIISFIKKNFQLVLLDKQEGLLTGYYEPLIKVSTRKDQKFKYPILKKNKKFIGKSRYYIEKKFSDEDVLIWTDDKIDLFFLHIQGSGVGILPDKRKIKIIYDGNNNKKYQSIGKIMVQKNLIKRNQVSMFTIKKWLKKHPAKIDGILNKNERYIFFKINQNVNSSPKGALGINLISKVSIAIDKKIYPLGLPFMMNTPTDTLFSLAISADTGAAIKGANRADIFMGRGEKAANLAGVLKKKLFLHAMVPRRN